jgi:CheY-like chemotaxis protein
MQFGLVRAGFQVRSVRSAEDAERVLADAPPPAMVVSEVRLPGLDGFAFCARLRRSASAEVPVLLLTSEPSAVGAAQAVSAGADDYLTKPLFVGDLATLARLESSRAPGSPTLVASTRDVPLSAALRALLAGTRSGRLVLGSTGELLFRSGEVVAARFHALRGERALRRLLFLGEGSFAVHLGPVRIRSELAVGLRQLCGSWDRDLAAWRELVRVSVPLEAALCPDLRTLLSQIADLPHEVEPVVRLFDGERSVRAVVAESSLPEMLVLQVATRLYASGALLPARVARARGLAPMPPPPPPGATTSVRPGLEPNLRLGSEDSPPTPEEMPTPPGLPELPAWDAPTSGGEMERAMRSLPLGLEPPAPAAPRTRPAPPPTRETGPASRSLTPSTLPRVPMHRPPTPPSVPVALEAGEESPLAVAARAVAAASLAPEQPARFSGWLPLVGVAALSAGFLIGSAWIRLVHAPHRPSATRALSNPADVSGWLTLARARFDAGDGSGAEEAANQAVSLDGTDPRPHLLLANFHLRRGRSEHARASLQRVLELEPSGPQADEARALLATIP